MTNQRCNQDHQFCLNHPILDLTLRLSLGGCDGKCYPVLPKASMPPSSFSAAAIRGGGSTSGRRISGKKRVRKASNPVVPQEVPPPVLTEATIDSVMRNIAFRRAIAFIRSGKDRHPGKNEAKHEAEGVQAKLPEKLIGNVHVKVEVNASSSNENLGTLSIVPHTAQVNEEAKYENMEQMFKLMPRVTTSGGVPNGREIEGVLHQFFEGKIIIVCVCHGYFLSPEKFVQHAGGQDLANPMRHIYIQP